MTTLWVLSVDFRNAPLDLRAQLADKNSQFTEELAADAVERVYVNTCNRVEIYGVGDATTPEKILERWSKRSDLPLSQLQGCVRVHENEMALAHLFRVTASMESMVIGETQITSQMKRAYEASVQAGTLGPILHRSFQRSFKVAKSIRSNTDIGRFQVSIPSIGVRLAEKVVGDLATRRIGVAGLGEIGRVAAEHFASVNPLELVLYNRTPEVVDRFLAELVCEPSVHIHQTQDPLQLLGTVDVLVSAIDHPWLTREHLLKADSDRQTSLFILDLAVPRSVAEGNYSNLFLFSVDDLKQIAEENNQMRLQALRVAEEEIQKEVQQLWSSLFQETNLSQTVSRLATKWEALTRAELETLRSRLKGVSDKDWQEIEKMADRLRHKFLQDPTVELRSQLQVASEPESILEFFRNLFRV